MAANVVQEERSSSVSDPVPRARHVLTRACTQPVSHRVCRSRWVWANRPQRISAAGSGASPARMIWPGHGTGGWAAHQARNCSLSRQVTGTGRPLAS